MFSERLIIKSLEVKENGTGTSEIKIIGTPIVNEYNGKQNDFELNSQRGIVSSYVNIANYDGVHTGKIVIEIELLQDQNNNLLVMTPINE